MINTETPAIYTLPKEIHLEHIACRITAEDALSACRVSLHFAKIYGDDRIWQMHYNAFDIKIPARVTCQLSKKFRVWRSLQAIIESSTVYHQKARSFCIVALLSPELLPLHDYAIKFLKNHCNVPEEPSVSELILRVAREDEGFEVFDGARLLALKSLSKRIEEPIIQQTFLSIALSSEDIILRKALKVLKPYFENPEIKEAIITIQSYAQIRGRMSLDILITIPELFDPIIIRSIESHYVIEGIVRNCLGNADYVTKLIQILTKTNDSIAVIELSKALKPIADQEQVQHALCKKLISVMKQRNGSKNEIETLTSILCEAPLTKTVKETYSDHIPILQKLAEVDTISILAKDPVSNQGQLLSELWSENEFIRIAAANALAPLIADNTDIITAFLERISVQDFGEVGVIVVAALATQDYYQGHICTMLLLDGPLHWKENPNLRLATVQALRRFVNQKQVREAFLNRLKNDPSSEVRCELIDSLASQLDQEDVRTQICEIAKETQLQPNKTNDWQVAIIEKLETFTHLPDVKNFLLEFSPISKWAKAARIRALCPDQQRLFIKPNKIFIDCISRSNAIQKVALRALSLWVD